MAASKLLAFCGTGNKNLGSELLRGAGNILLLQTSRYFHTYLILYTSDSLNKISHFWEFLLTAH